MNQTALRPDSLEDNARERRALPSVLYDSSGMKTSHLLQMLLLSAIWGVSFLLIRISGDSLPPLWVALLRCSTGAFLLWVVLLVSRRSLPPIRFLPWMILVALFNNAIPFTFFAWGERTIPSSSAAVVNATTPILTLMLTLAVHRSQVHLRLILGVLMSFAGVILVVSGRAAEEATDSGRRGLALGVMLVVFASLGYSIATVLAKAKLKGIDPIGLATTQLTLASLWLLPAALLGPHPAKITAASWAAITTLGLIGSGVAYLIYYSLLAHISATHVVAVTYLLPIWGLFWGWLAHESIGWQSLVGVAVVIAGLILLNWQSKVYAPTKAAA